MLLFIHNECSNSHPLSMSCLLKFVVKKTLGGEYFLLLLSSMTLLCISIRKSRFVFEESTIVN